MAKIQKRNCLKRTFVLLSMVFLVITFAGGIAVGSEETEIQSQIEKLKKEREYYQRKIEEIDREIRELEKKTTYGNFSIILVERHKFLNIRGQEATFSVGGLHRLPKGADVFIVMLRTQNDGDKYIFVGKKTWFWGVRPGYVVDNRDELYGEEGHAIKIETAKPKTWVAEVKTKAKGWVKVSPTSTVTDNIIAPGEGYDWLFVFYVPKERTIKTLIFRYKVAGTATEFGERCEISIPLQKMNVLRG